MKVKMYGYGFVLTLLLQLCQVNGYGSGAPMSTCFTQYPKHQGTAAQTGPSPFLVTFDPPKYRPGEDVTINVTDTTGASFVGIQMAARRTTSNPQVIEGQFFDYPDKLKTFNCFSGVQNMITHANNMPVTELSFKWKPDSFDNDGDVRFIATLVRSFNVFWRDVTADLPVDSTSPVRKAAYEEIPLEPLTSPIDFDECGDTKGCFYYPRSCSGSDCKVAATYRHRQSTKDFVIELHVKSSHGNYVSLGFSDDEKMGNDATLSCTGGGGGMSVQEGWNPAYYNERLFNKYSSSHEVMYQDGKLQCRFVVPEKISKYSIDQANTQAFESTYTNWNLMDDWYLFMAWGYAMPDSDVMTYHPELPVMSSEKIDITEKVITFTSTFHVMVQVHAILMVIAWVLFAGIVTVISRHYRDWLEQFKPCGKPLWFQIHRTSAILVAALTLTGIIVIFVHYGTGIRDMATPHAYVGIACMCSVGLQLIAGMLRPDLDHSWRPVFNIGHRLMGHASHILAVVTMFLAYDIDYMNSDIKRFGFISLSVWVGVQLLWHLAFEIIKRFRARTGASNTYSMGSDNDLKPEKPVNSDNCPQTTTLVTYILTLMAVCAAAMMPVLIY